MNKKRIFHIFLVIVIIALLYIIFISKWLFRINLNTYLKKQGLKDKDIESCTIIRNSKQGGYDAEIVFKDDKDLKYVYSQYGYNITDNLNYKNIYVTVFDKTNTEITINGRDTKLKHKSLN